MKVRHFEQSGKWNAEREVVNWLAAVDDAPVMFAVARKALEDLVGVTGLSVEECLSMFELNRPEIERAAERVYLRGQQREQGVYLITSGDLNG